MVSKRLLKCRFLADERAPDALLLPRYASVDAGKWEAVPSCKVVLCRVSPTPIGVALQYSNNTLLTIRDGVNWQPMPLYRL